MDVREAIDALNNTGRVATPLRAAQRNGLYQLLHAYGITDTATVPLVGERDLIALYEAACIDIERGQIIAHNINKKYSPNPLLDPVTVRPLSGLPGGQPEQRPATPRFPATPRVSDPNPPSPRDMDKYALKVNVDSDIRTLRSDLNLDYRARVGELRQEQRDLQKNLTDTLVKVTEALPEVVKAHTLEALKALTPVTLHVVRQNEAPTVLGTVHRKLAPLIKMLAAGVNVYLHGPAGSGKTTAGRQVAESFGLPFYFAAKVESEYMLLGFKDARGETVRTQFREAYEHGGVFLFDELDGSSPSAVVALNAALANGICPFPDGTISRHKDFKCIGAGNTKLSGASRQYVGRAQLDAASIDRFAFLEWGYDDALETALATDAKWCEFVQAARKAVADRGLPHLITPRATLDGCRLLEAGIEWDEVASAVVWKGLDAETVSQVLRSMQTR